MVFLDPLVWEWGWAERLAQSQSHGPIVAPTHTGGNLCPGGSLSAAWHVRQGGLLYLWGQWLEGGTSPV